ncbi:MAG: hypothetical protein J5833_07690 [Victivallales bacterium]|nr:hypothetical protein [Victivallales bacterium]
MKKLLACIIAAALFPLAANLSAGPAEEMLAAAQQTKEGLVEMADKAKNTPAEQEGKKPTLDPVAYEALILAHKGVPLQANPYYSLNYSAPAAKALSEVTKKYYLPKTDSFIDRLLANPDKSVRFKAVTLIKGGLFGSSSANRDRVIKLIAKETAPEVQMAIVSCFANDGGKDAEIGKFLVKCLDNADPVVRQAAVSYSCSSWNFKTPGLAEKIAELIANEKNAKARLIILEYSGKLGKDVITDALAKVLEGNDTTEVKGKALKGLLNAWWFYPLYNTYNEKAYKATLAYIPKIADESANLKLFDALTDLSRKSSNPKTLEEYAKNAPWYVAADVKKAILPLIDYEHIRSMTRARLIAALYAQGGTKEEVTEIINKLLADETLGSFDKGQYERVLKELK